MNAAFSEKCEKQTMARRGPANNKMHEQTPNSPSAFMTDAEKKGRVLRKPVTIYIPIIYNL